jgi:pectate lyase
MSEPNSRASARFVLIFCTLATAISSSACGPASAPAVPAAGAPDAGDVPDGAEIPEAGDAAPPEGPPAFPGAVGWAARTLGGRGGAILRVTTLELSGPGSLAEALGRSGPRIIVFEVGGVIDLRRIRLEARNPYVTIAGQTAPSPGITLIQGGLLVRTHDVIVQHVRVRPGEAGRGKMSGWEVDAITTEDGAYNVIVDHCSATWGTDENLSASGSRFVGATPDEWRAYTSHVITFSNNIVAEGLGQSTHSEGEHSKGGLMHDNVTKLAIVGNLYFSNNDRHPLFKGGARGIVVNNYVANPGRWAMQYSLNAGEWGTNPYQNGQMAIVGNVFTYGPSTPADVPLLRASGVGPVDVYMNDNVAKTRDGADAPSVGGTVANIINVATPPIWPEGFQATPAGDVANAIRANVGARPWDRDAIDTRIVEQALAGEGAIIDSEQDVGGYPVVEPTSAPFVEAEWDLTTMVRKSGLQ